MIPQETVVLLPGLDGTGALFAPFVAATSPGVSVSVLGLPQDRPRGYDALTPWVLERLPPGRLVLVAESFSGPLAVFVAARCARVAAVVLVATFVTPPVPSVIGLVPPALWRVPPPELLLRALLTGGDAGLARAVRLALRSVPAPVLAGRVSAVLRVDATDALRSLTPPVLYLQARGDRLIGADSFARIRAIEPDVRLARIDGPHLLLQAAPAAAWAEITSFLTPGR